MTGDLQASSKVRQGLEQVLAEKYDAVINVWVDDEPGAVNIADARHLLVHLILAWHLEQVAALLDESREDVANSFGETAYSWRVLDVAIAAIKQRAGMSS